MELSIQQQVFDQLGKAKKVLIALPNTLDPDSVGSGLALSLFLKKIGKDADVVASAPVPEDSRFLPGSDSVKKNLVADQSLVISVNTQSKELEEISYEVIEGKANIFVKAKQGQFEASDVTFLQDKAIYDLIVTIGCCSLEDLGAVFEQNTQVFFQLPKINIDNHPDNEFFGAINFVDINASSSAEMLSQLFSAYEAPVVDEDIATCLLTGIISKTNSFQHAKTTPAAFLKASELISLGGRQQEVVKFLYKTKSLSLLRLWGRALARLKIDDSLSLVYSLLNEADFTKAEAAPEDFLQVLKELAENIAGYKTLALVAQTTEGSRVLLALHPTLSWETAAQNFGFNGKASQPFALPLNVLDMDLPHLPFADAEKKLLDAASQISQPLQS